MSFNPSIPQVTDFLSISQKQLLANYQAIFNSFAQNHIALVNANQGKHNSLTFRPQIADPATAVDQIALYNKIVSSIPQLFFRPSSNQTPIQMTNSNLNVAVSDTQSTFIAGPFTVYVGFRTNVANSTTITLTPSTTLIYVGLGTILVGANIPTLTNEAVATNIAVNQFTIRYQNGITPNPTIYYLAIGSS